MLAVAFSMWLGFTVHGQRDSTYTQEQHIARISKRVEKRYMGEGSKYTDFKVYPLYNQNDCFSYHCLVEFEPYGYMYVEIRDVNWARVLGIYGMYAKDSSSKDSLCKWARYKIDENGGYHWETDETGKPIEYSVSHFKAAGIENETRYALPMKNGGHIPAVKRGDKYLNLISMEEFIYDTQLSENNYPYTVMGGPPKKVFDL